MASKKAGRKSAKAPKVARKMGRPTDYKPEYVEQARKLCGLGATMPQIADFFGADVSTVERWAVRYADFRGALKVGREPADEAVEQSLYHRAMGYSHPSEQVMNVNGRIVRVPVMKHYPPSEVACLFWLKNRRPDTWREKTVATITVTPEEEARKIKVALDEMEASVPDAGATKKVD